MPLLLLRKHAWVGNLFTSGMEKYELLNINTHDKSKQKAKTKIKFVLKF